MSGNTMRGTPTRNQGRGNIPFANSPATVSGIPRPAAEAQPSEAGSSVSASRQKQSKRDEWQPPQNPNRVRNKVADSNPHRQAIRRKIENDLSKKKNLTNRARHSRKAPPGTVMALKPSQALQIKPGTTVSEAAQLMAAKREDCVLVTDDDDRIAGIFTAKDLAFRVVGAGLKSSSVTIAEIMTKNPLCARTDTSATDALDLMVRKGFRHLPVMDENQDISGVLDITKCFYDAMEKLERAYSSSRKLYDALEGVHSELGTNQPQQIIQYVEALRSKMSGPTLETVLNGIPPTTVSVRTSVREAAALMKENHTTAVLVQDQGAITGIFTSKDVVLRVIAPGLDPTNCSVVRVMTPHPDFAPMDMTIQAALRKMHDGHYLNLPVMNDSGEIVGMVDVLKLTYATLEQINSMSTGDGEGPAWSKFWLSIENETESMVSGDGSQHHNTNLGSRMMTPDVTRDRLGDSVAPGDSASHVGSQHDLEVPPADVPFPFKFKAPSNRVHRLQVIASQGIEIFVAAVASKLGNEVESVGGVPTAEDGKLGNTGFAVSYMDDEGDTVSITTDNDLLEAILLARQGHRDKVELFVHDPEKPLATPAAVETPVLATPPTSTAPVVRERRRAYDEEEEEEDEDDDEDGPTPVRRSRRTRNAAAPAQEQLIAGVPNDLLLPGAIVTLAVVIVGVFTIARATSR
ncbi:mitochondrial ribosomal subunit S4 [Cordyceps militaris]|uniref:Mitochondrial ribosomal subunit S4 n=1 Tax=Cordyceps militaris TaxID=73501 RepID=A0A2H4SLT4_CORMI|nr:mitochondrial ribosomal subunit S4 [Cordyceps militaris]